MNEPRLLFDDKGDYIAFSIENYLYDIDGRWIGWFPLCDEIAYDINNVYLGSVLYENRLFSDNRLHKKIYKGSIPKFKGYPKMFSFPKPIEPINIPKGCTELKIKIPLL